MTREDRDLVASGCMTKERKLLVQRLGLVDYESALAIQKQTELAVKNGVQPDTLLLLDRTTRQQLVCPAQRRATEDAQGDVV